MSDLRVPVADGAILAEPPLHDAERLLSENDRIFHQAALTIFGVPLTELRAKVRASTIYLANVYLSDERFVLPKKMPGRLIVSGHQPELFHPGVWVKNFAINGLAGRYQGTALNLIIDNDAPKSTFLRIPVADATNPHWRRLPFDRWQPGLAYEECDVQDETMFAEFADRAEPIISEWPFASLLPDFWKKVQYHAKSIPLLGDRFAAARRALEREWGCRNLELPMHSLCQTDGFRMFAGYLFANLPAFHEAYNMVLREYRARHDLRSRNHPVPDLMRDGGWYETPFWVWRSGEIRERLWASVSRTSVALRSEMTEMPDLSIDSRSALSDSWSELDAAGFKIRTRALTTTLFARLLLADLFVHGIGGAKYDEITDELIRRFFKTEPPRFLVLSATLRLPFPHMDATDSDCRRLQYSLRDLYWNPQRHIDDANAEARELANEKQRWIEKQCSMKKERRERYRMLRHITDATRRFVTGQIERTEKQYERCLEMVKANELFGRRDYAFCLYPENELRALCNRVTA